jgi:hypothetical protein
LPFFLHFFLHVAGQKNLTFFPASSCSFLHLFTGFSSTYELHDLDELPLNRNESKSSHGPCLILHFFLHFDGQKNLTFLPPDSGCIFLHLLKGFKATYDSHVLNELPSNPKSMTSVQSIFGEILGCKVVLVLGETLRPVLGMLLGSTLGVELGKPLGKRLGIRVGWELGPALGSALGNELGSKLGTMLGLLLGSTLGTSLGTTLGLQHSSMSYLHF